MNKFLITALIPLCFGVASCADNIGATHYNTSSVNQVNRSAIGTVVSVRAVSVSDDDGQFGAIAGTIAGAAAGSMIGGSDAVNVIGGVGGGVVGGIAGKAAQERLSRQTGYEYIVRLDNGSVVTVVQGADILMNAGQRCIVIYGKQARVIPYNGY